MSRIKIENVTFDTCKCDVLFDLDNYVIQNIMLISNLSYVEASKYHWIDEASYGRCTLRFTEDMRYDDVRALFLSIIDLAWMNNETLEMVLEMDKRHCKYRNVAVGDYCNYKAPSENPNYRKMQNALPAQNVIVPPAINTNYPVQFASPYQNGQRMQPVYPANYPANNMGSFPNGNKRVKKEREPSISDTTARVLCIISLSFFVLAYACFFFQFDAHFFFFRVDGIYRIISLCMMTLLVAAIIMMIVVRVGHPKYRFGFVLMIIYIAAVVTTILAGIFVTIYQIVSCVHDCTSNGCNFY